MTHDQQDLLSQARESIDAARILLDSGYPGFAASRAYYAMFYCAEALLEGIGKSFSKHSAVISAFGREFTRTGKVPSEFHRYLIEAQELRHAGDYGHRGDVDPQQAADQIDRAKNLLDLTHKIIASE